MCINVSTALHTKKKNICNDYPINCLLTEYWKYKFEKHLHLFILDLQDHVK